ncbi:MAG: hypothetical protein ACK4TG_02645 [Thermaurantiacus sp.]
MENWHEQQPPDTPEEALMAPAALWLTWLALHDMVVSGEETGALDAALRARSTTPLDWYWERFGNAFYPEDLTPDGRRFTESHYLVGHVADDAEETDVETELGPYFDELETVFLGLMPWEIPGSWDSFDRIAPRIAASHAERSKGQPK